jgi:hypothetical protein
MTAENISIHVDSAFSYVYLGSCDDLTEKYHDIVEYVPGGATQNTTRIAQVSSSHWFRFLVWTGSRAQS